MEAAETGERLRREPTLLAQRARAAAVIGAGALAAALPLIGLRPVRRPIGAGTHASCSLSLAFMATGGFFALHAIGTPSILFSEDYAGFQVAIPVGLLVSAVFAAGSAFVDVRPEIAPLVIHHRRPLRLAVLMAMAGWFLWTVAKLPALHHPGSEAATGTLLAGMAVAGTIVYGVSAAR